jgi:endonuclease-3
VTRAAAPARKHHSTVKAILRRLEAEYSDVTTGLHYDSPFQLVVATVLSAQCTDARVNAVTPALFRDYPDVESFLDLEQRTLERYIKTCGLFRSKARNLLAMSRMLVEEFDGQVPGTRSELMRLPGVGRKTANVVLANAFGADTIAVDTHVFRVSRRLGLAHGDTPREVETELMEVLPQSAWSSTHYRLILHGRQTCKAQRPLCDRCPLTRWCDYYHRL